MTRILAIGAGLVWILSCSVFGADRLVVTRTGTSFWVTSVKQNGDQIEYVRRDTRQHATVPVSELHGVIPIVQRGKLYQPDEVQKYIDRTEKMIQLHGNLYRQLNVILQEWKALRNPDEGLGDAITAMEEAFESSDKGPDAYRMATLDLSMVKYKDVGGHFGDRVDAILDRIKQEYVELNKRRIAEMAGTTSLPVDAFVEMKKLAEAVTQDAGDDDSREIADLLSTTREAVYLSTCRKSMQLLSSTRSIDGYLECVRILQLNREQVAANSEEKATIDSGMAKLLAGIKSIVPQYRFDDHGYPLSKGDIELMREMGPYMSRITFVGSEPDEQCRIIPEQQPGQVSLRHSLNVPLRLILNRGQKPDQELAFGVKLLGGYRDRFARLGPVNFKDGHASVVLQTDFSDLPADFTLTANENGERLVYVYLAYLEDKDAKEGDEEWIAMSLCCGWRITP